MYPQYTFCPITNKLRFNLNLLLCWIIKFAAKQYLWAIKPLNIELIVLILFPAILLLTSTSSLNWYKNLCLVWSSSVKYLVKRTIDEEGSIVRIVFTKVVLLRRKSGMNNSSILFPVSLCRGTVFFCHRWIL